MIINIDLLIAIYEIKGNKIEKLNSIWTILSYNYKKF